MPTSSCASAMNSRRKRRTSGAWSIGQATIPASTVGPRGWSSKVKLVTMPKLPHPAPQRPEQLGVLLFAGHDELPLGGDHITGAEAVDGEAELAHQVTEPSAQGEATDAGVADDSAGGGQRECQALPVEVGVQTTALQWMVRASGSTRDPVMRDRSMTTPSSQMACPATACPPPRTDAGRSWSRQSRGERSR